MGVWVRAGGLCLLVCACVHVTLAGAVHVTPAGAGSSAAGICMCLSGPCMLQLYMSRLLPLAARQEQHKEFEGGRLLHVVRAIVVLCTTVRNAATAIHQEPAREHFLQVYMPHTP